MQDERVVRSGNTTMETGEVGPEIPIGFAFGDPVNYFYIETTASYTGAIEISIYFGDMTYLQEDELRLMHYETDHWVDVPTTVDLVNIKFRKRSIRIYCVNCTLHIADVNPCNYRVNMIKSSCSPIPPKPFYTFLDRHSFPNLLK